MSNDELRGGIGCEVVQRIDEDTPRIRITTCNRDDRVTSMTDLDVAGAQHLIDNLQWAITQVAGTQEGQDA